MIHQKIFQTITCKYHKSCKNKQFIIIIVIIVIIIIILFRCKGACY